MTSGFYVSYIDTDNCHHIIATARWKNHFFVRNWHTIMNHGYVNRFRKQPSPFVPQFWGQPRTFLLIRRDLIRFVVTLYPWQLNFLRRQLLDTVVLIAWLDRGGRTWSLSCYKWNLGLFSFLGINIKIASPGVRIPMIKIKWSWGRLIFTMGINTLERRHPHHDIYNVRSHESVHSQWRRYT